ncbi:hypothetical protein [Flavobacterium luteum]|uniref:Uncharacterized protein n=1 Tax=Flavobacterium luteum TaxID=2026654 RepID=A0A7J5A9Q5_9FLAO|nr:hypothetical protein [Flavobacterium luteum]KAB1154311.1 hypothetical protein F6464_13075 [Flavobacterium luteum]
MKSRLFENNFAPWFFIEIVILQSCSVYNKTPLSLQEAEASCKKVEVVKTNDSIIHFKKSNKLTMFIMV